MLDWMMGLMFAPQADPAMNGVCQQVFARTMAQYPKENLTLADFSMTVGLKSPDTKVFTWGHLQGTELIYPASVVKAYFGVYLAHKLDEGKIKLTPEIDRACREMLVNSNNDATGAVVNLITGALPGPELEGKAYERWLGDRMQVNRWFEKKGYPKQNILNRTYNEGPFGREAQAIKELGRNALSTNATARLMAELNLGDIVSPVRKNWLLGYISRDAQSATNKTNEEARKIIGGIMPAGSRVYSKSGWTSEVNHDACFATLPDGRQIVLVIFTKKPNNQKVLQFAAFQTLVELGITPWEGFKP